MPILVGCRNALKYLYEHGFPDDGHYGGLIEAMRKLWASSLSNSLLFHIVHLTRI